MDSPNSEWIQRHYDPEVNGAEEMENISQLKLEIKEVLKKKNRAYRDGLSIQFQFHDRIYRKKNELLYASQVRLFKHSVHKIKMHVQNFTLVVDFHGMRLKEAEIFGEMLLLDIPNSITRMQWITGAGTHSKHEICVLKQRLKEVLEFYKIKYEEMQDGLNFII